jgi:hypothetical protein
MDNLQQIVVQITTAPFERSLAQFGEDSMPENQVGIAYSELSASEKLKWDDFVEMIKSKSK